VHIHTHIYTHFFIKIKFIFTIFIVKFLKSFISIQIIKFYSKVNKKVFQLN